MARNPVYMLLTVAALLAYSASARASGPFPNRPPVFVGYPYGQQIADFTKLGGADYVFTRTVIDPDPGDIVTMIGYVENSPFTFSYVPGNPAVYEVRAANLGPAAIGGYIVDLRAFDGNATNGFAIGGINIVIIPEPAVLAWLIGPASLTLRRQSSKSS